MTQTKAQKSGSWTPQIQKKAPSLAPPPIVVQRDAVAAPTSEAPLSEYTPLEPNALQNHPLMGNISDLPPIQTKLTIGAPGDRYEQEADTIARKVVSQINSPTAQAKPATKVLQRQPVGRDITVSPFAGMMQAKEAIAGGPASQDLESSINRAKGGGQPLDAGLQQSMGQAMGADFSGVRVHTDGTSNQLNQSIQAKAFTTGQDVFFKQGQYNPGSKGGQELIAHELTHVVQQKGGSTVQRELSELTLDQVKYANQIRQVRGLDNVNTRIKFDSKKYGKKIEKIFLDHKSWDKIKSEYGSDLTMMWLCFDYRKWYVDSLISKLRSKYKGLIAKSVGSQDPTSDYDITISTPGSGNDVKAIEDFNREIKKKFGVQPGTLFDTNLYAKDYLKVTENIDEASKKNQVSDTDLDEPDGGFGKMGGLSQDVASLVKQRRYMNQMEWNKYVEEVVASIQDESQKKTTRHQYEEADAIYQIAAYELRDEVMNNPSEENQKIIADVNKKTKLSNEEEKLIAQQPKEIQSMVRDEFLGLKQLQGVTHENSDLVLEKSNKLYLQRMAKIREIQELIRVLSPDKEAEQQNKEEIETLKAQVKQLLGEACFFAAEAYHSEGAVKHIVAGVQGSKANPQEKQRIMSSLKPEHYLQSFNEQFGDFLKDLNHYAGEPNGKIFYRSSKYLYRLFLAVAELRLYKPEFKGLEYLQIEEQQGNAANLAQDINDKLVLIRKGDGEFKGASEAKKIEAAEQQMKAILNVDTASSLKVKILQMAQEFNSEVRAKIKDLSAMNPEISKQFFRNIYK
ncbi:DUF4157 domain-containing protein [Planktothricoides sp. SR001]|uniref:eCIS core domain-containing protein n=1 Tax=Planktothricoides sp. SR001 TaxID=1705388 RepID=UPI0006C8DD9E|nr:DUF4157 domain-containing protein [Planktothricoides sp. SR001]